MDKKIIGGVVVGAVVLLAIWGYFSYRDSSDTKTKKPKPNYEIKELGLAIAVSDDIKDLEYTIKDLTGAKAVLFSTKSLTEKGGITCSVETGAIGAIGVVDNAEGQGKPDNFLAQFGNTYVIYSAPVAPCSEDQEIIDLQQQQQDSLGSALKTIQKP